jgi:hypothetical protein
MKKQIKEINKQAIINIFKENFDFEIVETALGDKAIKIPTRDAYIFSSVTGASYLDNAIYPFSPKALQKLFYNAFLYNFVTGIFDNTSLKHTPYLLSKAKPFLVSGEYKYIVPIEFDDEQFLQEKQQEYLALENHTDHIVLRIETSKNGNGMEPFLEYLAGEYFKKRGFIVENQIPLAHSLGSPDFAGYGLSKAKKTLSSLGFGNGFHIIELALFRTLPPSLPNENISASELIVGEAKATNVNMTRQLTKYLDTGLFDYGFEIQPYKEEPNQSSFGLFSLDGNHKFKFLPPTSHHKYKEKYSRDEYIEWLYNYLKFYLIANLSNDEFNKYYFDKVGEKISSQEDIAIFVESLTFESIVEQILLVE